MDIFARDGDLGSPQPLRLSLEGDDSGYFALADIRTQDDGKVAAALVTSDIPVDREDPIVSQNGGIYAFYVRVRVWIHLLCQELNFIHSYTGG